MNSKRTSIYRVTFCSIYGIFVVKYKRLEIAGKPFSYLNLIVQCDYFGDAGFYGRMILGEEL